MAQMQNPTARGSRVLWNGLDGASSESNTPLGLQSQFLIGACHVRPELAAMLATLAFGGQSL